MTEKHPCRQRPLSGSYWDRLRADHHVLRYLGQRVHHERFGACAGWPPGGPSAKTTSFKLVHAMPTGLLKLPLLGLRAAVSPSGLSRSPYTEPSRLGARSATEGTV